MSAEMFKPPEHEDVQVGQKYEIAMNDRNGVWTVESKGATSEDGVTMVGPDGETLIRVLAWDLFPLDTINPEEGPHV